MFVVEDANRGGETGGKKQIEAVRLFVQRDRCPEMGSKKRSRTKNAMTAAARGPNLDDWRGCQLEGRGPR